jgi:coiled-coil and C2 domain-containing protein 2A
VALKPPEIDFTANAIEKAARYVSLIPFRNDTEIFRDLPDIYCNS